MIGRKNRPAVVSPDTNGALLKVDHLVKYFPIKGGLLQTTVANVKAVDDVSFDIKPGETLGLIGESGSGKSTVARTILRLIPPTSGDAFLEGRSIFKANKKELNEIRREVQIIFQDPYGSLNPRMSVGEIVGEGLLVHGIGSTRERERIVSELLEVVTESVEPDANIDPNEADLIRQKWEDLKACVERFVISCEKGHYHLRQKPSQRAQSEEKK